MMSGAYTSTPLVAMATSPSWRERSHGFKPLVSLPPLPVPVPPLAFGASFLQQWRTRQQPDDISWQESAYLSFAPSVFELHNALVHSSAGIVLFSDRVIRDTLEHTGPEQHFYRRQGELFEPLIKTRIVKPGAYVSLLTGSHENYFHGLIDSVGRLAGIPDEILCRTDGLLIPDGAAHIEALCRQIMPHAPIIPVRRDETLNLERLILPTTVQGQVSYHPCLVALFDKIRMGVYSTGNCVTRPAIYVDRRGAWSRQLLNEGELIEALRPLGVLPVRLEDLEIADQAKVFADANLVIAPHGAGLTNLLFAQDGCRVLELLMDVHVHWAFRRLAAVRGLHYDCILGRARTQAPECPGTVAGTRWEVSIPHVVGAVTELMKHA